MSESGAIPSIAEEGIGGMYKPTSYLVHWVRFGQSCRVKRSVANRVSVCTLGPDRLFSLLESESIPISLPN